MKEKDFEDARAKLEATNQKAQEDLQEKQASLQEPVYEKAKKVINEVAKELGYSTVINSTGGYVLLVSNSADDLMGPVKKKMGIADKAMGTPISPKK
jgi:outer membrane protein